MAIAWQLRYADGSTYSSIDGEPHESPPWGVVGVVHPWMIGGDDHAEWFLTGADHLLYRTDLKRWVRVYDTVGLVDQLAHYAHLISCVRPGRMIPTVDYKAISQAARDEWGVG